MKTAYCFDLDGTVTSEEILPLLSREIDLYEEIAALTEATIKGVIPFRKSFLLRCRLLSEIPISRVQKIISGVALYGKVADFIRSHREDSYIVTGNLDVWVKPLVDILNCRFYSSTASVDADRLVGIKTVLEKGEAIDDLRKRYGRIVAVGDGMGDVAMFERSDIRIAFGGTHAPIQSLIQFSDYITYTEGSLCTLLGTQ